MADIRDIADKLVSTGELTRDEIVILLENRTPEIRQDLAKKASSVARKYYGNKVYVRGLIEFTNYCKNDCYYCGIRCGNKNAERYRLTPDTPMLRLYASRTTRSMTSAVWI